MAKLAGKRLGCLFLVLIMLLLLGGCAAFREARSMNEKLEAEAGALLSQMMTCVERRDAQGAAALCEDPSQMQRDFSAIVAAWPVRSTDPYELRSSIGTFEPGKPTGIRAMASGETSLINMYSYHVRCADGTYEVRLGKKPFAEESKITFFDVVSVQELLDKGIEPAGTTFPTARKSFGQWLLLIFWGLAMALSLFMAVDVVRKRPKLWGLWLAGMFLFLVLFFNGGVGHFHYGVTVGIFSPTYLMRFQGGELRLRLGLPVGAILYWIFRNKLPRRPSKQQNQP